MLQQVLAQAWYLTSEMAPYLLLGFLVAGLLHVFFTEQWVQRHLGQAGLYQIAKAVVIGIPLPLCSCGVIPVAAGIRRQGGSRGAVAAFTAATPQTGVDAIAATVGMLGWVFTAIRVFIAFLNGLVAGLVVERWGNQEVAVPAKPAGCCQDKKSPASCCQDGPTGDASCCHEESATSCCQDGPGAGSRLRSGLRFGLVTLPGDLFWALVAGLLLAGVIGALVPRDLFASLPGGLAGAYLGITLVSLPLYICSTGSIPMAFTLLQAGLSPGTILIFLIAGPATNTATVAALWKIIGPRGTIGYILSIIATSWLTASLLDLSGLGLFVTEAVHNHERGIGLFQQACAGILLLVLAWSQLRRIFR